MSNLIQLDAELDLIGQELEDLHHLDWQYAEKYQILNLHNNPLTSLEGLPALRHLTELNLSSNHFNTCYLPELNRLISLKLLDLSGNHLHSLEGLPYLPQLQTLLIAFNQVDTIDYLPESCPNLIELDLRGNNLILTASTFTAFQSLRILERLSLVGNPLLSVKDTSSHLSRDYLDTICRLFLCCTSLLQVEGQSKESWLQNQSQHHQNVILEVVTPRVDQIVERFRKRRMEESLTSLSNGGGVGVGGVGGGTGSRAGGTQPSPSQAVVPSSSSSSSILSVPTSASTTLLLSTGKGMNDSGKKAEGIRYHSPVNSKILFPLLNGHPANLPPPSPTSGLPITSFLHVNSATRPQKLLLDEFGWQRGDSDIPDDDITLLRDKGTSMDDEEEEEEEESRSEDSLKDKKDQKLYLCFSILLKSFHREKIRSHRLAEAWQCWRRRCLLLRQHEELNKAFRLEREELRKESEKRLQQARQGYEAVQRKVVSQEAQARRQLLQSEREKEDLGIRLLDQAKRIEELERVQKEFEDQVARELNQPPPPLPPQESPGPSIEWLKERAELLDTQRRLEDQVRSYEQSTFSLEKVQQEVAFARTTLREKDEAISLLRKNLAEIRQQLDEKTRLLLEQTEVQRAMQEEISRYQSHHKDCLEGREQLTTTHDKLQAAYDQLLASHEKLTASFDKERQGKEDLMARLEKVSQAYEEIHEMNLVYQKDVERYQRKYHKSHTTIQELSRYVKELEDVIAIYKKKDFPTPAPLPPPTCEQCNRYKEENRQLQDKVRDLEDHLQGSTKASKLRMEQLDRLEATITEIESKKSHLIHLLEVKETIIKDQLAELNDLKRRYQGLEKDYHLLEEHREEEEVRRSYLEDEVSRLQKEVRSKVLLEEKVKTMVAEYLEVVNENPQGTTQNKVFSYSSAAVGSNKDASLDLAAILEDIQDTAVSSKIGGVCTNKRCQERIKEVEAALQNAYDQLSRQKKDFDRAYADKVDDCKRFAEALHQLESKSQDLGKMIETDKKRYEDIVQRLKTEKKQAQKRCKQLEDEIRQKEQELVITQQASRTLQEAFNNFQKLAAVTRGR
eukprot:gene6758-7468_t